MATLFFLIPIQKIYFYFLNIPYFIVKNNFKYFKCDAKISQIEKKFKYRVEQLVLLIKK